MGRRDSLLFAPADDSGLLEHISALFSYDFRALDLVIVLGVNDLGTDATSLVCLGAIPRGAWLRVMRTSVVAALFTTLPIAWIR